MNKILSFATILGAALTFVACSPNEEDDIFDQSAAKRLNAASELYSSRLTAQPNGWVMQLYPTLKDEYPYGNGYIVLMRFAKDHTVKVGMNNVFTNNTYAEDSSHWDVITDDGPVLSFDTYNKVFHLFSDPYDLPFTGSKDVPNNEQGKGAEGDYEYIIVDAPEDASYMMLKGKKRSTYNLLTPMEQGVDYKTYLQDVNGFQSSKFSSTAPNGCLLTMGDSIYHFDGAGDGLPTIYLLGTDSVTQGQFNPFLITKRGSDYYLRFRDEFAISDTTTEQEFLYDAKNDIFKGVNNANHTISGYYKGDFVKESFDAGHRFLLNKNSSMSQTVSATLQNVISELHSRSFNFSNITLQSSDNGNEFVLNWKKGTQSSSRRYGFTFKLVDHNTVDINYTGTTDNAGQLVLNSIPSLASLFQLLSGEFTVTATNSNFNLSQITLTSKSNPDVWFVLTYRN